jgi:hypothetical protein
VIGGEENVFASRRDLEPNLDTIVYDTGVMILTNEAESGSDIATNYNDDSSNRIFDDTLGAQTARIIIYVDFKRNVLFGEIESTVTLQGESGMTTLAKGGAADISNLDFGEPIDKELTKTLDTTTGGLMPDADAPYAYWDLGGPDNPPNPTAEGGKHSITSIVRADGTPALFEFPNADNDADRSFPKRI